MCRYLEKKKALEALARSKGSDIVSIESGVDQVFKSSIKRLDPKELSTYR